MGVPQDPYARPIPMIPVRRAARSGRPSGRAEPSRRSLWCRRSSVMRKRRRCTPDSFRSPSHSARIHGCDGVPPPLRKHAEAPGGPQAPGRETKLSRMRGGDQSALFGLLPTLPVSAPTRTSEKPHIAGRISAARRTGDHCHGTDIVADADRLAGRSSNHHPMDGLSRSFVDSCRRGPRRWTGDQPFSQQKQWSSSPSCRSTRCTAP